MNRLEQSLRRIAVDLDSLGRPYAVVGGLAVSVRAAPRLTRDVDVALSVVDDAEAEVVVASLRHLGYDVLAVVEQDVIGRLATVRLSHRADVSAMVTDLLFASSGLEPEIVAAADVIEVLPGLFLPIATTAHLIVMKLLARHDRDRPNDADDLRSLAGHASPDDWEHARSAAALVHARRFERDRDLLALLDELQAGAATES